MTPQTEILLKRLTYKLAAKYRQMVGSTSVYAVQPTLQRRAQLLPPLRHDGLADLVHAAYAQESVDHEAFTAAWDYLAGVTKSGRWRYAKPFYEFASEFYPDLSLPSQTPRGAIDVRGFLCQFLTVAHYRLTVPSTLRVAKDEVLLHVDNRWRAAVTSTSLTWKNGHTLVRRSMDSVDFRNFKDLPLPGQRLLSTDAAALHQTLLAHLSQDADYLDTFFRCVALLGPIASDAVCEPFLINITDDPIEQAWEVHSLLETQRQLKGTR